MNPIIVVMSFILYLFGATTFDGEHYVVHDETSHAVMCFETADDVADCLDSWDN